MTRFLHVSDLHLGKPFYHQDPAEFLEVQEDILDQIAKTVKEKDCDCLVIAGDIFDKPIPSEEAVLAFDRFLDKVEVPVLAIAGNHDSAKRLQYGKRFLEKGQVYLASRYEGKVEQVKIKDTTFCLLPFIKPLTVRPYQDVRDYQTMMETVLDTIPDKEKAVLVAHQFILGGQKSGSELESLGGLDNISPAPFQDFAYCALGHLHSKQHVKGPVWYSGTPMALDFPEAGKEKGGLLVDLAQNEVEFVPFAPKRRLVTWTGTLEELTAPGRQDDNWCQIVLEDELEDPMARVLLEKRYPRLCQIQYRRKLEREERETDLEPIPAETPAELACRFYKAQTGQDLSETQETVLKELWEELA